MTPPIFRIERALIFDPLWFNVLANVRERLFVFRAFLFRTIVAEIDDEHMARPSSDIESVYPRHNHV